MYDMHTGPPQPPFDWPVGLFHGAPRWSDLVREVLQEASRQGWSELWLSDPDFADWPLGERQTVESLHAWVRQGRRLRLLARGYEGLRRAHPRFVAWRALWSHKVEAHAWSGAGETELPSALWTPVGILERLDTTRSRGRVSTEPAMRRALQERLEEAWRRARPSFAPTTLGL